MSADWYLTVLFPLIDWLLPLMALAAMIDMAAWTWRRKRAYND